MLYSTLALSAAPSTIGFLLVGVFLVLFLFQKFNTAFIPGPLDALRQMENAITKTATFNGTTLTLETGFAPKNSGQPHGVVIVPTAVDRTTGDETYAAVVQESADGGSTWVSISPSVSFTTAKGFSIPVYISQPSVRLQLTLAGTTPSITYSAWLVPMANC